RLKMAPPRYQDIKAGQVALLSSPDGGALVRVIAGEVGGYQGPGVTHTPITLLHATLQPGAQLRLPWRADFNALGYVMAGSGTGGTDPRPVRTGQLAAFGPGTVSTSRASGTVSTSRASGTVSTSRASGTTLTFAASDRADGPSEGMELLVL